MPWILLQGQGLLSKAVFYQAVLTLLLLVMLELLRKSVKKVENTWQML